MFVSLGPWVGVCPPVCLLVHPNVCSGGLREGTSRKEAVTKLECKSGGQGPGHLSPCSGPCCTFHPLTRSTSQLGQGLFTALPPPRLSSLGLHVLLPLAEMPFIPSLRMPVHPSMMVQRLRNPLDAEDLPICCPPLQLPQCLSLQQAY